MDALRTPEERFVRVPDFDPPPNYVEDLRGFEGLRMHLVDEGPPRAPVYLCLHGEPTWSFLYRKLGAEFLRAGGRWVAPDWFGFGRSDKPVEESAYTFHFHRDSILRLIEQRDLREITLVCQDWGGLIGLTLPMEMPARFRRLLIMNTALGTGDVPLPRGFLQWRSFVRENPDFSIAALMRRACPELSPEELAAYEAPFPDHRHRAGVRRFPDLVPEAADDPGAELSRAARHWLSHEWTGESFMAVGGRDPVLGVPVMRRLRRIVRGCPEPWEVEEAGHFVPEYGAAIARRALEAWGEIEPQPGQ